MLTYISELYEFMIIPYRPNYRVLYPQWIYYTITFFNLVGRLTWAMTLVPNGILEDYVSHSYSSLYALLYSYYSDKNYTIILFHFF